MVCKTWQSIAQKDQLWKELFLREFRQPGKNLNGGFEMKGTRANKAKATGNPFPDQVSTDSDDDDESSDSIELFQQQEGGENILDFALRTRTMVWVLLSSLAFQDSISAQQHSIYSTIKFSTSKRTHQTCAVFSRTSFGPSLFLSQCFESRRSHWRRLLAVCFWHIPRYRASRNCFWLQDFEKPKEANIQPNLEGSEERIPHLLVRLSCAITSQKCAGCFLVFFVCCMALLWMGLLHGTVPPLLQEHSLCFPLVGHAWCSECSWFSCILFGTSSFVRAKSNLCVILGGGIRGLHCVVLLYDWARCKIKGEWRWRWGQGAKNVSIQSDEPKGVAGPMCALQFIFSQRLLLWDFSFSGGKEDGPLHQPTPILKNTTRALFSSLWRRCYSPLAQYYSPFQWKNTYLALEWQLFQSIWPCLCIQCI